MASSNPAAFDYLEMAHECMREAEETADEARKQTLVGIAKMYRLTATLLDTAANASSAPSDGGGSQNAAPTNTSQARTEASR